LDQCIAKPPCNSGYYFVTYVVFSKSAVISGLFIN
jgi:hypothetical protein